MSRVRTVLVTGAAHGIGSAVTKAFAEDGASVAATDRDQEAVTELARTLCGAGHTVRGYGFDVATSDPNELVATVQADLGAIDVLANVAGILRTGAVVDTGDDDWDALLAVNATGVFALCRAAARVMIPRRDGTIVTVSSNAASVPRKNMAAYAASKAAATMFTKSLGLELAEYGIRCNVVAPGSTDTPMQRGMWPDGIPAAESAAAVIAGVPHDYKVGIPLNKLATAQDIADAVLFLCSEKARHITMHDLYVDGGATLRG